PERSSLRRPRHQGLRSLAVVRLIPEGRRFPPSAGNEPGAPRQRRRLRAGELRVGFLEGTGQEQEIHAQDSGGVTGGTRRTERHRLPYAAVKVRPRVAGGQGHDRADEVVLSSEQGGDRRPGDGKKFYIAEAGCNSW